jgi:hypothetical protein
MSRIVLINGLDKKTLSGYVVFSVKKQKKGTDLTFPGIGSYL